MKRTLLIDGDIIAYKAATAVEKVIEWEPGEFSTTASLPEAQEIVDTEIANLVEKLDASDHRIALTDSDNNFRKQIFPAYKAKRGKKPMVMKALKAWLVAERKALLIPTLEGDDVLGIMATHPAYKGEKIIVSIDKDMQSIPGLVFNPAKDKKPREITEQQADRFHLIQTLSGDATDEYPGCPGIGKVRAARILDAVAPGEYPRLLWEAVVKEFKKAGFGEEYALTQARVARILRAEDYDSEAKKVRLWSPTSTR